MSSVDRHWAINAGRASMLPFQMARAESYAGSAGVITVPANVDANDWMISSVSVPVMVSPTFVSVCEDHERERYDALWLCVTGSV